MSVTNLTCDFCDRDFSKEFDKIATLTAEFQVPGRIEHVCQDCVKLVDEQLAKVRKSYQDEIAGRMREWLLEKGHNIQNLPKSLRKSRIITQ